MPRWSEKKIIFFLDLYRSHECLWNVRSPLYKDKVSRASAYQNLLESLNDNNINMIGLKIKIKNLRSVYHNELRKIKKSKRCGSFYKPSLSWFHKIHSFLGDSAEYHGISHSKKEPRADISSEDDSELPIQDTDKIILQQDPLESQSKINNSKLDDNQQSTKPNLKFSEILHENEFILNTIQRLENISRDVNKIQKQPIVHTQDEFYFFALSIAAQLRNLPLHIAIEIQSKIQNILSEARISSILSNTSSPPSLYICNM